MFNSQALSSVFDTRLINNGAITGANYVSGGYANHVLFHMGTSKSGQTITETLTATADSEQELIMFLVLYKFRFTKS